MRLAVSPILPTSDIGYVCSFETRVSIPDSLSCSFEWKSCVGLLRFQIRKVAYLNVLMKYI